MFKMSVSGWVKKALSKHWYTAWGCCQQYTLTHKVYICSLQGCVHTAVQATVLLTAYTQSCQRKRRKTTPRVRSKGGAQAWLLWSLYSSEGSYHTRRTPLGRKMKGHTVYHWLHFHSKLFKDFKTLWDVATSHRKILRNCAFCSLHRLWSQIASMPICHVYSSKAVYTNLFWIWSTVM